MFGFGTLRKASNATDAKHRLIGLDVTASRARAVAAGAGRTRTLNLDGDYHDLPMLLGMQSRSISVGHDARTNYRRLPHAICSNFIPLLGRGEEWRGPRIRLNAESATLAAFQKLAEPIRSESATAALTLPIYLDSSQVTKLTEIAAKARMPLWGTASGPLAVAAHRSAFVLIPHDDTETIHRDENDPGPTVLPMRVHAAQSGSTVLVIDVDEYALTAALIGVTSSEVRMLAVSGWRRYSLRHWYDRLIDALADRCIRICRRDPRDSADGEQALYEQLDPALDEVRQGRSVRMTLRGGHWHQDMELQPAEMELCTQSLLHSTIDDLGALLQNTSLPSPPRAIWLSNAAGRLPGLAMRLYQHAPPRATVSILPDNAFAEAAASLLPRWLCGSLPRVHLDDTIPLERRAGNDEPHLQPVTAAFLKPTAAGM